ncbi:ATP-binding protein [Agrobacterium rhizogenes]|uniref:NACHT domain-containing protein n=1 Tax=Rhizobium rhizogenes TaxID=359 RepID=UPI001573CE82|nr:ATP-binding protein [Rhizobium rhizogenes]NTI06753.1 ATP-binding protein [Rhizobium rhizogenes]NTI13558.1 ATP-binding protein [Rhizobium rhizogenes]
MNNEKMQEIDISTTAKMERLFRDLSDQEVADIETASVLSQWGWSGGLSWGALLSSSRVLILSEAGSGKTYECQAQQALLWEAGEAAFFIDLATLARQLLRDTLSPQEEHRFDEWRHSQSSIATFFLDSIDELKLSLGNFEQALKQMSKSIAGHVGRARIVITTRPIPVDRNLIDKYLPIPPKMEAVATAEAFADMMMDCGRIEGNENKENPQTFRTVGLMPLSSDQIRTFAKAQNIADPDAFLADIVTRDAVEFAGRPQDLIEMCADWREQKRIGTHKDQIEANLLNKLKRRTDRRERAELAVTVAIQGASRLALASILTRKFTIRYSAEADAVPSTAPALDASKLLVDWGAEAQATLLERPLFGFASYGRVRIHQSVLEYLAAKRLQTLLSGGVPIKAVKRLLFTDTLTGQRVIRPSMRPVAAWLSLRSDSIFADVVKANPELLIGSGDPHSLSPSHRVKVLEALVSRYSDGGWRGLGFSTSQVRRFSSPDLADCVKRLWDKGIENAEVRELLLGIVGQGRVAPCADIAYAAAVDAGCSEKERILGVRALVWLDDTRLSAIAESMETDVVLWPDQLAKQALVELFPRHMPAARVGRILQRVRESAEGVGDLTYWLPAAIESTALDEAALSDLRKTLSDLIERATAWYADRHPHYQTDRADLLPALHAVCLREIKGSLISDELIASCLLSIRVSTDRFDRKDFLNAMRKMLAVLPSERREKAFWNEHEFLDGMHHIKDAWTRVFELSQSGGITLNASDGTWIRRCLSDREAPFERREMMLWAEMVLLQYGDSDPHSRIDDLKRAVSDDTRLTEIIDTRSAAQTVSPEIGAMQSEFVRSREEADRASKLAYESWVDFWGRLARNPEEMFGTEQAATDTAWNLWRALSRAGAGSRATGWDRQFIERQFDKSVADRLRQTLMTIWRKEAPTLRSERPPEQREAFLVKWQFGLAAISAEAEDKYWTSKLNEAEAALACRYVPIEMGGFPSWFEGLANKFPKVVDNVLGEELTRSLEEPAESDVHSIFLQNIEHAQPSVSRLFLPRIHAWFSDAALADHPHRGNKVHQAMEILLKDGSEQYRSGIETIALQKLEETHHTSPIVWLRALFAVNSSSAVDALEKLLAGAEMSEGRASEFLTAVFGRDFVGRGIDLNIRAYPVGILARLTRLAFHHIALSQDADRQGVYQPDSRDEAEFARNAILNALLSKTGVEGWAAKVEIASDPSFAGIRDRIIALASESAANEADIDILDEVSFVNLDRTGETPPMTRDAMFAMMRDRLDDIDDLLLRDDSPRELWATIRDEHVMRRVLTGILRSSANGCYTADQEAVTADEKETDIRLRSPASPEQATIELKLADGRSGKDLFDTIHDQLLTKYMAAEHAKSGCLVVTNATDREWEHPVSKQRIPFTEMASVLQSRAEDLSRGLGGAARLMVKCYDLRPRLGTEANSEPKSTADPPQRNAREEEAVKR